MLHRKAGRAIVETGPWQRNEDVVLLQPELLAV